MFLLIHLERIFILRRNCFDWANIERLLVDEDTNAGNATLLVQRVAFGASFPIVLLSFQWENFRHRHQGEVEARRGLRFLGRRFLV